MSQKEGHSDNISTEGKEEVDKILKKESGVIRTLSGFWGIVVSLLCFGLVGFYLYGAGIQPMADQYHRGIYVLATFLLVFLMYPFRKRGDLRFSYTQYRLLTGFFLVSVLSWVWMGFFIDYNDITAKKDLGYIVYYITGVIILIYCSLFLINMPQEPLENDNAKYWDYIFLALAVATAGLWLYQFYGYITYAEQINYDNFDETFEFIVFQLPLGITRGVLGWGFTITGIILLIYNFIRPLLKNRNKPNLLDKPVLSDIVFFLASLISVGYWILVFGELNARQGNENDVDFLLAVIGILVSIEVTRRVLGWSLTIIGLCFLLYAYFGSSEFFSALFLQHGGLSLKETAIAVFINNDGTFGIMANVLATYVILFIFFGAFLEKSGATKFFINFAMSAAGKTIGGPAKVAVIASSLFGSISGSAIANTVSTGVFTIPLMKRAGFRPHVAGAIEPSASIAGMFLPPIMGAGGFIMAEMTDTSYDKIMLMAIFPAFMYILGVFAMIHLEAKKYNLKGISGEEKIERMKDLLKKEWFMLLPLLVITWMMLRGYSPGNAAFYGVITCVLVSIVSKVSQTGNKLIRFSLILIPIKVVLDFLLYIIIKIQGEFSGFLDSVYYIAPHYFMGFVSLMLFAFLLADKAYRNNIADFSKTMVQEVWDAMQKGARQTLIIGATVGVIGIIVGVMYKTGVARNFSNIMLKVASAGAEAIGPFIGSAFDYNIAYLISNLKIILTVILVAVASLFLGMGVPVTAAYIITVTLVAPALSDLGVALIAAHMVVYWFSQDSNITPPVCIAAYAGAAIAGANPWKTGWTAFKFAKMLYVMPILFAFVPAVLFVENSYKKLDDHSNSVQALAYSPRAKIFLSADADKKIKFWDANKKKVIKTLDHPAAIKSIAFSADGKLLALGDQKNIITLVKIDVKEITKKNSNKTLKKASKKNQDLPGDLEVMTETYKSLKADPGKLKAIIFSKNKQFLASLSENSSKVILWDINTGTISKTLEAQSVINSVSFSANSKMLASGNRGKTITVWELENGSVLKTLNGHSGSVNSVAFFPYEENVLASAGDDAAVRFWEIKSGKEREKSRIAGYSSAIKTIAISPDNRSLAAGSDDETIVLWNINEEKPKIERTLKEHDSALKALSFSSDSRTVISASENANNIILWELKKDEGAKLFQADLDDVLVIFISCMLGTIAFSALTMLYLNRKTNLVEWLLLLVSTMLLYWPTIITTLIGLAIFVLVYYYQNKTLRNGEEISS